MNSRDLNLKLRTPLPVRPLLQGLLLACTAMAAHAEPAATPATDGALQSAPTEVQRVARWVVASGDNAGMPFLLVDKPNAQVLAFNAAGELQGAAPALLGMAVGDRLLVPNDATKAQIPPQKRITPAGRFVSRLGMDSDGMQLLVMDYDAAISLHPVIKGTPAERRAERLGSATSRDNRISYGCINVPAEFYANIVSPAFAHTKGIVYVLPETAPSSAMFALDEAAPGKNEARLAPGSVSRTAGAISRGTASAP